MDAPSQDNVRELDPFGFMLGHASVIRPLGGSERGPDPRYAFHTPYVEFRRGRVIFHIKFDRLQASFGELRVFINAFVPGSGRDALFVTSSRLDLTDRAAVERGLTISFLSVAGATYAAFGICIEGTDARAAGLTITAEQGEANDDATNDIFLLPTRFETAPVDLPTRLVGDSPPRFRDPVSQLLTEEQLAEPEFHDWVHRLANTPADPASAWNFAFIGQALERYGMLKEGARGITLGGGGRMLGPVLAAAGCEALVGQLPADRGVSDFSWLNVNCRRLDQAGVPEGTPVHLVLAEEPADQRGFDFMWTIGMAVLGYQAGHSANFLFELMTVLRPGGFAIHIFDVAPEKLEQPVDGLPRSEVERLAVTLISRGFTVAQLNFGDGHYQQTRPFGMIVRKD